jgi:DNA topoisomerase-1
VQSVVLKLIVERERLIHDYKKKKEYIVCGIVPIFSEKIVLKQVDLTEKLIIYQDLSKAEEILTKLEANFQLIKKKTEDKKLLPKSPLTTSLLLFEAKSQLGFSVSKTTQLAQKLYEGIELSKSKKRVGLITYPRTDSTRINQEFQKQAYNLISQK